MIVIFVSVSIVCIYITPLYLWKTECRMQTKTKAGFSYIGIVEENSKNFSCRRIA